tara:strand:+ start:6109 stop:6552 length:444 start_codon:yes stop_codon:yes gene_type:complete
MSTLIENLHYNWTVLLLLILFINVLNSVFGRISGKKFSILDLRICLFGIIFSYFHLLISLTLYFISSSFDQWSENDLNNIIMNNELRSDLIINPLINLFAVCFVNLGWKLKKNHFISSKKYLRVAIFYGLGLILFVIASDNNILPSN